MTPKFSLITALSVMGIIIISGCINEEKTKEELGDEILNIGESIPEGWNYTIITHNLEDIKRPHGLWEPAAVNFTNLNKEIEYYPDMETDKKYNPSLRLYFYNITEKQEIIEIIDKERMHSWCIPIYFDEAKKYIIVTNGTYIPETSTQTIGGMTFEESIERGLTVIENVELSENEKAKQSSLIDNIPEDVKREFNTKYGAWKETWDDPKLKYISNPRMFTQSRQYEEFLSFCKEQDKTIWPLLFQKYEQGDRLAAEAIIDLIYYTEYGSFLDEIRQESTKERYTTEGAYIAPSENANMMKYIKKLLALI